MNDELSGQLTSPGYRLPTYAQRHLWLEAEAGVAHLEGERGLFALPAPAERLILRYGHEAGAVLAALRWSADTLDWDGVVRLGGFVDALHMAEVAGFGAVGLLFLGGQPLQPQALVGMPASRRAADEYAPPDYFGAVDDTVDETTTTWLVSEDSPLLTLAQDALMNRLRVWFTGRLAAHQSGWERHFALPLLLETVTLFGP
jgi:hypothetical protein